MLAVVMAIEQFGTAVSQSGAIAVDLSFQNRIRDRERPSVGRAATAQDLVAALRQTEQALRASVEAEEMKTCVHDQNSPYYSTLAQAMRARADNIRMTITTLETMSKVA